MEVVCIQYRHFRGLRDLTLHPTGHVVLLGPPRSGRSAVIEGLARVLDPETTRRRLGDEYDFYEGDKTRPAEVEAVIIGFDNELEQDFLDQLEVWSGSRQELMTEAASPQDIDDESCSWALRLTYRLEWNQEEERADEFVYYSKTSDSDTGVFSRAKPGDIERIGFRRIRPFTGRLLDLSDRGRFRELIESGDAGDFGEAVATYLEAVEASAGKFTASEQLKAAAKRVLKPISDLLGIREDIDEILRFVPEGGAVGGLLRSLMPTLDLGDGAGLLPANRHGSSVAALLRVAEALGSMQAALIAIDDLGDGLDAASALHTAALCQKLAGQAWISTRNTVVAEVFDPPEVFRLSRGGDAVLHQGRRAGNKVERISAKHWLRSVLPALAFRVIVILEGPDDLSALHSLALRQFREKGTPLPGTPGVTFVSAAAAGSGGSSNVPRVAQLAREMGLWAIAVIDWDKDDAQVTLERAKQAADTVIRLPEKYAIERLMVTDIAPATLASTISELAQVVGFQTAKNPGTMTEAELHQVGIDLLKASGGLHAAFLEMLPMDELPPGLLRLYELVLDAATKRTAGHLQM